VSRGVQQLAFGRSYGRKPGNPADGDSEEDLPWQHAPEHLRSSS
jgi:hypothetical protein